jgi:hypothetical protein
MLLLYYHPFLFDDFNVSSLTIKGVRSLPVACAI